MKRSLAFFGLLAALGGCAGVNPRPAFDDASAMARSRTNADAEWARSPAETARLEERIQPLLAQPLTAESAVQIALWNNRGLQASFEEIGISQSDAAQAGLPGNPEFGISARFPDRPPSAGNLEIGVAQSVLDFVLLPRRKKIALAELERTKLGVVAEILDLVMEVKVAFYTLQADLHLTDRLRLILDVNEASMELARRQNEAGNLNDLDLAAHNAVFSQSKVDLALSELQTRSDRERLNRLLGLWGPATKWTVSEELSPPPEDETTDLLESAALLQRPELQASRLAVDVIGQALALKKKTRFFPVGVQVGIDVERDTDRQIVTGPSLVLQLPIFDFGRVSIARLESQRRQAERRLEALAVDVRSEVRELRDLVAAGRELADYYRKVVLPQRLEILDLTLLHYNSMLKGAYDLLSAKQNQVAAERAFVQAWRDYWIARARLERALGGRFPDRSKQPGPAQPSHSGHQSEKPDNPTWEQKP